ncbi:MAG: hypothetical protein UT34_C0002G0340 [candidate division WS6 bacterium GW2011_GWF2_39_15]|uniref:DUF1861 family protein n=1 Tax=candidate division WS6 bacterium GW2011_GWF2_39_15 TaxID=1619100 RepID=A0A0G0MRN1_9BACT|nr:MAG: hypothetical protein UT34_C0002G0340 [candidate division WS6 bacterium GW2011_GWF2_39_15]
MSVLKGKLENFQVPDGHDVYNPTIPFMYNGREIVAIRLEPRINEFASIVVFYQKDGKNRWVRDHKLPSFSMQDPFITKTRNEYILGGVKVTPNPNFPNESNYSTVIYVGKSLENMFLYYESPNKMKGIRILELENRKIAVFSRPQVLSSKDPMGRGRIAFALIDNLTQITVGIQRAEIIEGLYKDEEWGGCNEVHELDNGDLGILGHIAYFDEKGNRHYHVTTFEFNPTTKKVSNHRVIVKREIFPKGIKVKRQDLEDVLYPGGIRKIATSDKYEVFVGISDTSSGKVEIGSPFSSTPKLKLHS